MSYNCTALEDTRVSHIFIMEFLARRVCRYTFFNINNHTWILNQTFENIPSGLESTAARVHTYFRCFVLFFSSVLNNSQRTGWVMTEINRFIYPSAVLFRIIYDTSAHRVTKHDKRPLCNNSFELPPLPNLEFSRNFLDECSRSNERHFVWNRAVHLSKRLGFFGFNSCKTVSLSVAKPEVEFCWINK